MLGAQGVIGRHQLLAFFALAFVISWLIWIGMAMTSFGIGTPAGLALEIIGMAGPSVSAVVVAIIVGNGALGELLEGFSLSRVSLRWALIALALPMAMIALALVVSVGFLGAPSPIVTPALTGVLGLEFVRVLFLGGPLEEEPGWRGFALPRLQARRSAFAASIFVGFLWGIWHIPLYFVPQTGQYQTLQAGTDAGFAIGGFVVWTIGLSVLLTWLFNETRGSLIVVMLFHASVNLGAFVPAAVHSAGGASLVYVLVTWLVAILVIVLFGRRTLARSTPATVIRSTV